MPGKSKRATKKSAGERRSSRPVRLTDLQKVLLGGGAYARLTPIGADRATQGLTDGATGPRTRRRDRDRDLADAA